MNGVAGDGFAPLKARSECSDDISEKSGGTAEVFMFSKLPSLFADGSFLFCGKILLSIKNQTERKYIMKALLEQIRIKALAEIESTDNTEELRIKYLGKKGELTAVLRGMGKVSPEERPIIGGLVNEIKAEIETALTKKAEEQKKKELERRLLTEKLDVTIPGKELTVGHRHPIAQTEEMLREIFIGMGFSIAEGPEV